MDTLTGQQRSERMSRIKSRNTGLELKVRKLIHGLGFRYRIHAKDLPGRPDIVFRKRKLAIFVHGCFWHRHPDRGCALARLPKSRLDFWLPKLEGNRRRDLEKQACLEALGWTVCVIWECQATKPAALHAIVAGVLGKA